MGFLQLIQEIRAKLQAGDITFVDVVRYLNLLSGQILAVIDGVPMAFGVSAEEGALAREEICQLYEEVTGEAPVMGAAAGGVAFDLLAPIALEILAKLIERLRNR